MAVQYMISVSLKAVVETMLMKVVVWSPMMILSCHHQAALVKVKVNWWGTHRALDVTVVNHLVIAIYLIMEGVSHPDHRHWATLVSYILQSVQVILEKWCY